MISDLQAFERQLRDARSKRDIEVALAHLAEDVRFASPVAGRVVPETGGVVSSKGTLRRY
ncbi:hypothetical protein Q4610_14585 [Sphingobium sp. HBC34]|uniref:Nuclear transport factor 2 family protein n=1 Tax=Sphingobium cyanobacteriorum TaxID=3063954 RepID=A0ABT8ZQB6_9SPHN|nr:hypothetical protein [Sphingobium sp. HBC34]MDO7836273.1 hypothetical protein [Sphingobium sp. HBC34]